jgi:hypothetical protein
VIKLVQRNYGLGSNRLDLGNHLLRKESRLGVLRIQHLVGVVGGLDRRSELGLKVVFGPLGRWNDVRQRWRWIVVDSDLRCRNGILPSALSLLSCSLSL